MSFFANKRTAGGYPLGEVVSALQKEIRRGNEEQAMFWAIEVESIEHKYLWNRLCTIVSEDVGLASTETVLLIDTLYRWYVDAKARGNDARHLFLGHAILAMCRAPKSRLTDDFILSMYLDTTTRLEIPDYALDKHTARGKAKGRGYDHFFEVGAIIHPEHPDPKLHSDEYRALAHRFLNEGRPWKYARGAKDGDTAQGELGV